MDLSEKVAIVTGKASGVGHALCSELDQRAAAVVVVVIRANRASSSLQ